jgi:hypothetical protein
MKNDDDDDDNTIELIYIYIYIYILYFLLSLLSHLYFCFIAPIKGGGG